MKTRKLLAILLTLAMMMGLLCTGAMATDPYDTEYDATTGLYITVSSDLEKVQIDHVSGSTYALSGTVSGYFPQSFSLIFSTGTGVTVSLSDSNASFQFYDVPGGYGAVNLGNSSCSITVSKGGQDCTILCPAPVGSATSGSGVFGYLPAAGQFTNEGVTTGGWGDAFTSTNNGLLKDLVDNTVTTGVSLGAFGGYVVLDYGAPLKDANGNVISGIFNDPENEYGIDFILYGNVNGTTAEPGCVQVSPDGINWYDIAGSQYYRQTAFESENTTTSGNYTTTTTVYSPGSEWYYSATYTNPVPADDELNAGAAGTINYSPSYDFYSKLRPNSTLVNGSGSVTYNSFHRHSFYPLFANYFADRTTSSTPDNMRNKALANLDYSKYFGTAYTPYDDPTASDVTLRGVRLIPRTSVAVKTHNNNGSTTTTTTYSYPASDYLFGYADVHPNGTASGSQVNPYDPTTRNYGGDPIDISWAVEPMYTYDSNGNATANPNAGQPHPLEAIHYVRVYTGVQQMNGVFGEISTELCGSYRATGTGSGEHSSSLRVLKSGDTTVYVDAYDEAEEEELTPNMSTIVIPYTANMTINVYSGDDYVYVNGVPVSCTSSTPHQIIDVASGDNYQIITQSDTESPYITLLKVS